MFLKTVSIWGTFEINLQELRGASDFLQHFAFKWMTFGDIFIPSVIDNVLIKAGKSSQSQDKQYPTPTKQGC